MLEWETPPPGAAEATPGFPDAPHCTAPGLSRLNTALAHRRCAPGETIYVEGDAAQRIYEVVGGLIRTVRTARDGRRMVDAFFVPGDVFGLTGESVHASTAEAVVRSRLRHCERASAQSSAFVDRAAAAALWSWMARNLERAAARGPLLARGDAHEKVQSFLFEMADRLNAGPRVELAMSRYDIADYLGLSSETVSRTFTALRARGLIALEGRTVVMLEPMAQRRAERADLRL
jgi:CRP-like cAMP-binding protein